MAIELDTKDYIMYLWMADDFDGNNFLMLLRKRESHYLIDYRFRYKKDDKIFDSVDEKSFYQFKRDLEIPELEVIEKCQEIFRLIGNRFCMNSICQRINGGLKEFEEVLERYDCLHTKKITGEELDIMKNKIQDSGFSND